MSAVSSPLPTGGDGFFSICHLFFFSDDVEVTTRSTQRENVSSYSISSFDMLLYFSLKTHTGSLQCLLHGTSHLLHAFWLMLGKSQRCTQCNLDAWCSVVNKIVQSKPMHVMSMFSGSVTSPPSPPPPPRLFELFFGTHLVRWRQCGGKCLGLGSNRLPPPTLK